MAARIDNFVKDYWHSLETTPGTVATKVAELTKVIKRYSLQGSLAFKWKHTLLGKEMAQLTSLTDYGKQIVLKILAKPEQKELKKSVLNDFREKISF